MKTTNSILLSAALIVGSAFFTGCQKSDNAKKASETTANSNSESVAIPKIAFVEVDSILSSYQFCVDHSKILEKKGANIQATLSSKGKALQNAAANFQQKVQQGTFTSQEQAVEAQASLQKQDEDLRVLQEKLTREFEEERQKYNEEMRDSIENFLKDYNKTHKYSIILSKIESNILYADKAMNITQDVLKGLNKRYKASKEKK